MACKHCGAQPKKLQTLEGLPDTSILPEYDGAFSIVKPGRLQNLFPNGAPILPRTAAGYTNFGTGVEPHFFGSIDDPSTGAGVLGFTSLGKGCGGGWAHVIDPATGAIGMDQEYPFPPTNLEIGKKYIWCVDVEMERGGEFQLQIRDANDATFATSETFIGSGCCQRVCLCFDVTEQARAVDLEFQIIRTDNIIGAAPWYVSAWTLTETKTCNPVTFFDGYGFLDWNGADYDEGFGTEFNGYYQWEGEPYGSTSTKGRWTRSAGELVNLKDCGLRITGWSGLGMPLPRNIRQGYAKIDGAYSKGRTYDEHDFSLNGRIYPPCDNCGSRQNGIDCARAKLIELISDCSSKYREPLIIRYQPQDECGRPCGCPVEIVATYEGGLEGIVDNCVGEDVEIRFNMARPCVRSANRTSVIGVVSTLGTGASPSGTGNIANYVPAYCNNGSKPAPFTWVFSGSSDGTGSFCVVNIRNEDTGDEIIFDPPVDVVGNQQVAVSTDPENPFASHFDFDTGVVTDLSGQLAACSNLNGMELVCGINHFSVTVDKIIDPSYDPNNMPTQQFVPPLSRLVWREQFWGISEAACKADDDCPCGADDVIDGWDFAGPI